MAVKASNTPVTILGSGLLNKVLWFTVAACTVGLPHRLSAPVPSKTYALNCGIQKGLELAKFTDGNSCAIVCKPVWSPLASSCGMLFPFESMTGWLGSASVANVSPQKRYGGSFVLAFSIPPPLRNCETASRRSKINKHCS